MSWAATRQRSTRPRDGRAPRADDWQAHFVDPDSVVKHDCECCKDRGCPCCDPFPRDAMPPWVVEMCLPERVMLILAEGGW